MSKLDSWDPYSRHSADVFTAEGNYCVSADTKLVRFLGDISLALDVDMSPIDRNGMSHEAASVAASSAVASEHLRLLDKEVTDWGIGLNSARRCRNTFES
jgi:hypothetical protein